MLLELAAGNLYSWVAPLGKLAFQPGRLDAAVPLSRDALPANDEWFQGLWDLAMQLLDLKPENRPSMSVALLSDFFTSDKYALDVNSTPTDTATHGCQPTWYTSRLTKQLLQTC